MIFSTMVLNMNIPVLLIWILVAILVTLIFKPVVFHNLICPFGVLQKTFGRFAIFSEKVDKKECTGCKSCEGVCTSDAIQVNKSDKKAEIEPSLCFQCTDCVQVCLMNWIHYIKNNLIETFAACLGISLNLQFIKLSRFIILSNTTSKYIYVYINYLKYESN